MILIVYLRTNSEELTGDGNGKAFYQLYNKVAPWRLRSESNNGLIMFNSASSDYKSNIVQRAHRNTIAI